MNEKKSLLNDFAVPTLDEWRVEVERLLKGAPFAKKMFTKTLEGLSVGPMYTAADSCDLPWGNGMPGQAPFLRGNRAAGFHAAPWLVAQELPFPTCEAFNQALHHDLQRGQTAVNLVLDRAGHEGLDPDQAASNLVGAGGTSLGSLADLETALEGVDLSTTPFFVQSGSSFLAVCAMLIALLKKQGIDGNLLRGCVGSDPIFGLVKHGRIPVSMDQVYDELAVQARNAAERAPAIRTLPVFEDPWHEGGADSALSLGLTLAGAVHTLRAMEQRGIEPATTATRLQFFVSIGSDFFMEIAKLRALRMLWSDILTASGCPAEAGRVPIHARTSRRTQSVLDPHVNMLRATTQAMSAVFGGADSLHVSPFDESFRGPDEFSRRIARNVQLILARECRFDQVADPAGGSWYVESLTRDLARAAWEHFQTIEKAGGILKGLESGLVQEMVAEAAARRAERLATRRDVLIGTNQYPDPADAPDPDPKMDHEEFHRQRNAAMEAQRTSSTQEGHLLVLAHLEKIVEVGPDRMMERMIDAASEGATLGELTGVLRYESASDLEIEPIPLRRDAEPFENLRVRVKEMGQANEDGARVMLACLGDTARYMPRLEFTRRFFRVGGFDIVEQGFFSDVAAVIEAAHVAGAGAVALVGLDDTYSEMAAEAAANLGELDPPPMIFLAGQADIAGVDETIHARSDVLDVLGRLAAKMEGRS
ncbi:MAG: acyl-CoA mutase large subunit family protein [Candidatus Krumholzibacteria bacterium]|nr:acyl-CoA mutase large subunit family protein [Candidatus Krumholzibacteria bacterium]